MFVPFFFVIPGLIRHGDATNRTIPSSINRIEWIYVAKFLSANL